MRINIPANGAEIRTTKDWVGVTCRGLQIAVPAGAVIRVNSMKYHRTYDQRKYDFVALRIYPRKGVAAMPVVTQLEVPRYKEVKCR